MSKEISPEISRAIDANLNRFREGLRVVEDILRYSYNDKTNSSILKEIRHQSKTVDIMIFLASREVQADVLKTSRSEELLRKDLRGVVIANFKRAQESARVLEELFKLVDISKSEIFKSIRYRIYEVEKVVLLNVIS
ncbi:MAG: thiamine-phosphate pyrophosphorylase [Sulfuricurvum sp.]